MVQGRILVNLRFHKVMELLGQINDHQRLGTHSSPRNECMSETVVIHISTSAINRHNLTGFLAQVYSLQSSSNNIFLGYTKQAMYV